MKYIQAVLLLGLLFLLVTKGIAPGWHRVHSDFANYYVAADLVTDRENLDNIYDNAWFQEEITKRGIDRPGKFSPFPPMSAWIMTPLVWLSPLSAQRAFLAVNVLFLIIGVAALKVITKWSFMGAALLVLGSGVSLFNNFAYGQVYWIMTSSLLFSFLLYQSRKPTPVGILIGFFSVLKYIPVLLVAGYFFHSLLSHDEERRRSRVTTIAAVVTMIMLGVAQLAFFGEKVTSEYVFTSLVSHVQSELPGQNMYSYHFQSWDSLLRNLLTYDLHYNPSPSINWSEGRHIIKLLIVTVLVIATASVMHNYRKASQEQRRAVFLSILPAAGMVILPASASYHFIFLLIPVALLIGGKVLNKKWQYFLIAIYCGIGSTPYGLVDKIAGLAGFVFAYPRLWLVSAFYVVMVVGLVRSRPTGIRRCV